ncbi:MAG TPA: methionine biosynthesis protein MetW [Planctomycetaceae bacterium]|nr:methionine biosynthesis protein MetW [Planctomycetaceae bacterium]
MSRGRYRIPDSITAMTDEILLREIPRGSRVIDLGCGDGRLLQKLRDEHACRTILGVELDVEEILGAVARGVPVIHADLDDGLKEIADDAFDVAVLSQTLQQVRRPKDVLANMMRVARRALVVVPNFAHWRIRLQLAFQGRAPITDELPYEWYDSPNLHVMSMTDFRELARQLNIRVLKELPIVRDRAVDRAWVPNLRAVSALYVLERAE